MEAEGNDLRLPQFHLRSHPQNHRLPDGDDGGDCDDAVEDLVDGDGEYTDGGGEDDADDYHCN